MVVGLHQSGYYRSRALARTHVPALLSTAQKQKNAKKVDIITMATGWGCKVMQLEELLAELKRLKPLHKKEESQVCEGRGRVCV